MDATHLLLELQQDKSFLINNSFNVVQSRVQDAVFGLVHNSLNHTGVNVHSRVLHTCSLIVNTLALINICRLMQTSTGLTRVGLLLFLCL